MTYGTYKKLELVSETIKVKSADEDKTLNAVSAIDTQLQINATASTRYKVYGMLRWTLDGDGSGYDWSLYGTAGFGNWQGYRLTQIDSDAPYYVIEGASGGVAAGAGTAGEYLIIIDGVIEITTAGTLGVFWAQQTSHADAVTFRKGSYIEFRPVPT